MNRWHSREWRANSVTRREFCSVDGCPGYTFSRGLCPEHWEPLPETTCGHNPLILCGACNRRVCEECYGHWKSLACEACRTTGRR